MDAAQLRAWRNCYVQLLKNLAADDGAQSHASGGRIHVCLRAYVGAESRTRRVSALINADLMLRFLKNNNTKTI